MYQEGSSTPGTSNQSFAQKPLETSGNTVDISLGFPSSGSITVTSRDDIEPSSQKRVPSWGAWPGLASLPRLHSANISNAPLRPSTQLSGFPRRGGKTGGSSRTAPFKEQRQCYQKKDRILFTGKPPTLLPRLDIANFKTWDVAAEVVVLISGLQWWITDCDVRDAGANYGNVRAVRLFGNPSNGASTGLALVEFTERLSVTNAINDNGTAWSTRQQDSSSLKTHRLNGTVFKHFFPESSTPSEIHMEIHWSFGTYIDNTLICSLYKIAQLPLPVFLRNEFPKHQALNIPALSETVENENSIASIDQTPDVTLTQSPPINFRFPFAAAAVISTVFRKKIREVKSLNRLSKRPRQEGIHQDYFPEKDQSDNILPSTDEDDYTFLEDLDIPYWNQTTLHPVPNIPVAFENQSHNKIPYRYGIAPGSTHWPPINTNISSHLYNDGNIRPQSSLSGNVWGGNYRHPGLQSSIHRDLRLGGTLLDSAGPDQQIHMTNRVPNSLSGMVPSQLGSYGQRYISNRI